MTGASPAVERPSVDARRGALLPYFMVALLSVTQVLNYSDRSVLGLAAPQIMRELHLSAGNYGVLASAFFIFYAVSGVVVGLVLSPRVRPRTLLLWLVALWSLTQVPVLAAPSLGVLIVARSVLGAAESPSMPTAFAAAHEWFPPDRRSLPTAIIMAGPLVSSVITPPAMVWVMERYGWRAGFAICAVAGVAIVLALRLAGRDGPDSGLQAKSATVAPTAQGAPSLWRDATLIGLTLSGFAGYWVIAVTVTWLFPMLRLGSGFSAPQAGFTVSAVYVLSTALLFVVSALHHNLLTRGLGPRRALVWPFAALLIGGGATLAVSSLATDPTLRLALMALGMGVMPAVAAAVPMIVSAVVLPRQRNQAIVVVLSLTTLAGTVAPFVTGRLVDSLGHAGYGAAIALAGAIAFVGGLAALAAVRPERTIARIQAFEERRPGAA